MNRDPASRKTVVNKGVSIQDSAAKTMASKAQEEKDSEEKDSLIPKLLALRCSAQRGRTCGKKQNGAQDSQNAHPPPVSDGTFGRPWERQDLLPQLNMEHHVVTPGMQ